MDESRASTVVIVGNDARFIYLIRYYSRLSGHETIVASPDDVVSLATGAKPAVIVLETDPVVHVGDSVLARLRADQATSHIPVIFCSWQDEDTSHLKQNADGYLQKPVSYEEFQIALEKAVRIRP